MILYHGSNVEVSEPRLLPVQRNLDFGKGFYTTTDFDQASSWAKRTARIRKEGVACVSCYEFSDDMLCGLDILCFETANEEWLRFVAQNRRSGSTPGEWDIVIGPVANDQTMPTLALYLDGYIDEQAAIAQLLPQKLKDQVVLRTERALVALAFDKVVFV